MCLFGKKEPKSYGFDITKADTIIDLLLSKWLIKLKPYHKIPSEEELKNMKYCKWHNATSHDTNECKVFRQQIQLAFEQGKLKFETPKRTMKIDQHPFATNMVDEAGEFLFYRLEVILGKMKTHQQIKSLECEVSLINLKELVRI